MSRQAVDLDRFVAFAFTASDILIELDGDNRIAFVEGSTQSLLGYPADELANRPLADIVAASDRAVVAARLERLRGQMRVERIINRFRTADGEERRMIWAGISSARELGRVNLTLTVPDFLVAQDIETDAVVDGQRFAEVVDRAIVYAYAAGRRVNLVLVDVALSDLQQRLPEAEYDQLVAALEARMRAWSAAGAPIGKLGPEKYGVVQEGEVPAGQIQAALSGAGTDAALPEGLVAVATTAMPAEPMAPEARKEAIGFTLRRFREAKPGAFVMSSLVEAATRVASAARDAIRKIGRATTPPEIGARFRPVVDMSDRVIASIDLVPEGDWLAPGSMGPSDTTLRREWDATLANAALRVLDQARTRLPAALMSITVSPRIFLDEAAVKSLIQTLSARSDAARRLVVAIETMPRDVDAAHAAEQMRRLRGAGVRLALNDDGSDGRVFDVVTRFPVDFLRFPSQTIVHLIDQAGAQVARSLGTLCADLKVQPIVFDVRDEIMVTRLTDVGLTQLTGDVFGEPVADPSGLRAPAFDPAGTTRMRERT